MTNRADRAEFDGLLGQALAHLGSVLSEPPFSVSGESIWEGLTRSLLLRPLVPALGYCARENLLVPPEGLAETARLLLEAESVS